MFDCASVVGILYRQGPGLPLGLFGGGVEWWRVGVGLVGCRKRKKEEIRNIQYGSSRGLIQGRLPQEVLPQEVLPLAVLLLS